MLLKKETNYLFMKERVLIYTTDVREGDSAGNQDVFAEAKHVHDGLSRLGYSQENIIQLPFAFDVEKYEESMERAKREILESRADYVFNLVEALRGKDGTLTDRLWGISLEVFEEIGIPYTGNPFSALEKTESKIKAKEVMIANKIPTPDYMTLQTIRHVLSGEKFILKSAYENGSEGIIEEETENGRVIKLFDDEDEIRNVLESNPEYFAEKFIGNREFNISIIGSNGNYLALPIPEIRFVNWREGVPKGVGSAAKWKDDSWQSKQTERSFDFPNSDKPLLAELEKITMQCCDAFELGGYARVDFRVENGNPYVLEINLNPGIDPTSGFVAAVKRAGMTWEKALEKIIEARNYPK